MGPPFPQDCKVDCDESAYYGVEGGSACFCSGTASADYPFFNRYGRGTCETPCRGNASETCGGTGTIDVYKNLHIGKSILFQDYDQ